MRTTIDLTQADSREKLDSILTDPIMLELLVNPKVTRSGHVFEGPWLDALISKKDPHPFTRERLQVEDGMTIDRDLLEVLADRNAPLIDLVTGEALGEEPYILLTHGISFNKSSIEKDAKGNYKPAFLKYLATRGIPLESVRFARNYTLGHFIQVRRLLIRASVLQQANNETPTAMDGPRDQGLPILPAMGQPIKDFLDMEIRNCDAHSFETLHASLKQNKGFLDLASTTPEKSIQYAYKIGQLEAKFSNHREAIAYFQRALDKLKQSVAQRSKNLSWKSDELTQLMEIGYDLSHALRILATKEEPEMHFEASYNQSQEIQAIVSKRSREIALNPEQQYLYGLILEEQVWSAMELAEVEEYAEYAECKETALEDLKKHTQKPQHPLALLKRAQYHLIQKDHKQAVADCQAALSMPAEKDLRPEHRAKLRLQLAISLTALKQIGADPMRIDQTLIEYYENPEGLAKIAHDHRNALNLLIEALTFDPTSRAVYMLRSKIHRRLEEYDMALRCSAMSLRYAPNDSPMIMEQCYAHLRTGNHAQARQLLKQVDFSDDIETYQRDELRRVARILSQETDPFNNVPAPELMSRESGLKKSVDFDSIMKQISENLDCLIEKDVKRNSDSFVDDFLALMIENTAALAAYIVDGLKVGRSQHLYLYLALMYKTQTHPKNIAKYQQVLDHITNLEKVLIAQSEISKFEETCEQVLRSYYFGTNRRKQRQSSKGAATAKETLLDQIGRLISPDADIGVVAKASRDRALSDEHIKTCEQLAKAINDSAQKEKIKKFFSEGPKGSEGKDALANIAKYDLAFRFMETFPQEGDFKRNTKTVLDFLAPISKDLRTKAFAKNKDAQDQRAQKNAPAPQAPTPRAAAAPAPAPKAPVTAAAAPAAPRQTTPHLGASIQPSTSTGGMFAAPRTDSTQASGTKPSAPLPPLQTPPPQQATSSGGAGGRDWWGSSTTSPYSTKSGTGGG